MMQREIARQTDFLRRLEAEGVEHQQPPAPFMNHVQEPHGPPLSPRQMPVQDPSQRRPSHPSLFEPRNPPPSLRNHFAPHVLSSVSPRRYGSIGSNNAAYTPMGRAPLHPPQPPPPPTLLLQPRESHQHPLATVTTSPPAASHLSRRHTSADIRLHGWQGGSPPGGANGGPAGSSPFGSGAGGYWPSSPPRPAAAGAPNGGPGDQAIRDTLAQYELPRGPSKAGGGGPIARQLTPPAGLDPMSAPPPPIGSSGGAVGVPGLSATAAANEAAWAVPGSRFPSYANKMYGGAAAAAVADGPPPARRSSMASNLHGLLNPASTAESGEEDEHASGESGGGGKRKRMG
jgi:hypothetical protein